MCVKESACVCELLFETEQFLKIAFRSRERMKKGKKGGRKKERAKEARTKDTDCLQSPKS